MYLGGTPNALLTRIEKCLCIGGETPMHWGSTHSLREERLCIGGGTPMHLRRRVLFIHNCL